MKKAVLALVVGVACCAAMAQQATPNSAQNTQPSSGTQATGASDTANSQQQRPQVQESARTLGNQSATNQADSVRSTAP